MPSGAPLVRLDTSRSAGAASTSGVVRDLLSRDAGSPLTLPVRSPIERSLGVDLGPVRVHNSPDASAVVRAKGARAFALGSHVFLGPGERADDLPLMAHEVTHVVQQQSGGALAVQTMTESAATSDSYEREAHSVASSVVSGQPAVVQERTSPRPQHLFDWVKKGITAVGSAVTAVAEAVGDVIGVALDFVRDHARLIPGYDLLGFVLGRDPITQKPIERTPVNLIKGVMGLWPAGSLIFDALQAHGIIDKIGAWLGGQLQALVSVVSGIGGALDRFLHSLGAKDLLDLGGAWNRAKAIFTVPIGNAIQFVTGLVTSVLTAIRDAILLPIAKLAQGTKGYDLLCAVLGKDPITGAAVPRDAATLIGGFMKLIGEEEIWENMQKSKAVPRAFAWFKTAMAELMAFVESIPPTFIGALKSLEVADMILIPRAFIKLGKVFLGVAGKFFTWAGGTIWKLLEIIFEVVSPNALTYIKKTGSALKSILKNPLPFVGNLVKAGKLGLSNFADHFADHLKSGLIDWLTGSLPGVYIPKAFALGEIVKFVFSVLGLSWANVRAKLVKVVGETAVKAMEIGFDIVVTLVTQGPAAAWEKIKDQLVTLKDQVIDGIIGLVVDTIIKKAIPKLVAMFIPGAGFISAIISIYDTVMVFVEKIAKIIQVVTAFIDSIVNIAAGAIDGAVKKVEGILANLLSLAISFLAGFLGLGKIADKIMGVIKKVRDVVDKGIDALINWIVTMAKKLFAKVFGKNKDDKRTDAQKQADLQSAKNDVTVLQKSGIAEADLRTKLPAIKDRYKLTSINLVVEGRQKNKESVHVDLAINPETKSPTTPIDVGDWPEGVAVGAKIKTEKTSKRIEEIILLAKDSITYSQSDSKNAVPVKRPREFFIKEWDAGLIALSTSGMTAKELRAFLTKEFNARVADAVMGRGKLADAIGAAGADQAHHLIPVEILTADEFLIELVGSGWDFNQKANGEPAAAGFHGNHPNYNKFVFRRLQQWKTQNPGPALPEAVKKFEAWVENTLLKELRDLVGQAKTQFAAKGTTLNDFFANK